MGLLAYLRQTQAFPSLTSAAFTSKLPSNRHDLTDGSAIAIYIHHDHLYLLAEDYVGERLLGLCAKC